jgi:hypothetical protein
MGCGMALKAADENSCIAESAFEELRHTATLCTMSRITVNDGLRSLRQALIVRLEPAIPTQPSERPLHDPAPRHYRDPRRPFAFRAISSRALPHFRSLRTQLDSAPAYAPSAQITRKRRNWVARTDNRVCAPSRSCTLAAVTITSSTNPSVSTRR